jgi:hypothetical protein
MAPSIWYLILGFGLTILGIFGGVDGIRSMQRQRREGSSDMLKSLRNTWLIGQICSSMLSVVLGAYLLMRFL